MQIATAPAQPEARRYDLVWAEEKDILRCEALVKTLTPEEQQRRGLRAPWLDTTPVPVPERDGNYDGRRGHLISVNIPGIKMIPHGLLKVPNSKPPARICCCKEFVEFTVVDGLTCGTILPAFWERKEVKEAAAKQAIVERDKAAKLRTPPPEEKPSPTPGPAPTGERTGERTTKLTRAFFETIAWRTNTGSANPASMPDDVLFNTFMMVKLTKQLPLPPLDSFLEMFGDDTQEAPAEVPEVPDELTSAVPWVQWTFPEFLKMCLYARSSVVTSKTTYKDARTGKVRSA